MQFTTNSIPCFCVFCFVYIIYFFFFIFIQMLLLLFISFLLSSGIFVRATVLYSTMKIIYALNSTSRWLHYNHISPWCFSHTLFLLSRFCRLFICHTYNQAKSLASLTSRVTIGGTEYARLIFSPSLISLIRHPEFIHSCSLLTKKLCQTSRRTFPISLSGSVDVSERKEMYHKLETYLHA